MTYTVARREKERGGGAGAVSVARWGFGPRAGRVARRTKSSTPECVYYKRFELVLLALIEGHQPRSPLCVLCSTDRWEIHS